MKKETDDNLKQAHGKLLKATYFKKNRSCTFKDGNPTYKVRRHVSHFVSNVKTKN